MPDLPVLRDGAGQHLQSYIGASGSPGTCAAVPVLCAVRLPPSAVSMQQDWSGYAGHIPLCCSAKTTFFAAQPTGASFWGLASMAPLLASSTPTGTRWPRSPQRRTSGLSLRARFPTCPRRCTGPLPRAWWCAQPWCYTVWGVCHNAALASLHEPIAQSGAVRTALVLCCMRGAAASPAVFCAADRSASLSAHAEGLRQAQRPAFTVQDSPRSDQGASGKVSSLVAERLVLMVRCYSSLSLCCLVWLAC